MAEKTASIVNKLLGNNHKWHDLERKPYTCSFIVGGIKNKDTIIYNDDSYLYFNTEDPEVIDAILANKNIEFNIENNKVNNEVNLLTIKRVIYNNNGKKVWITEDNKSQYEKYLNLKYGISAEILKIRNYTIHHKNVILNTSDLLIKCSNNKNVANLFESGIGGSCSIGFGFVENINKQ
jgi:CRISPR-associated endoribonuclease Cas6